MREHRLVVIRWLEAGATGFGPVRGATCPRESRVSSLSTPRLLQMRLSTAVLLLLVVSVKADWFDDVTEKVSGGFHSLGEWVKGTAAPVVRDKFNEAKEKLQDPETHRTWREWISEVSRLGAD